ncbi:hypothetical protein [Streptomyces sp. NBC_00996]|uniref:hypothetical protein n=1 Tax=Streptomyces sp. NBC_00996 TaxID=2903710 RepID=UPI00386B773E|nr:hypothetical protein OG390_32500 [Streptomyces sp. NBC_00996]
MQACGCGEEQIPWMLAKFGLLGTAGLVLAGLVLMMLAGWALGWSVWLVRRRGERTRPTAEDEGLAGFTWRDDEP